MDGVGRPGETHIVPPLNLNRLTRVYGPTMWDVYARLDVSLNPHGPDSLHELAAGYLRSGDTVLDAGCRDAGHLIQLVGANDVSGVGIDPVEIHIERARAAVSAAGLDQRITLHHGVMHDLAYAAEYFDLVWCRDVLEQVDDLDGALRELSRTMSPNARLLVYTTFATDRLEGRDAQMMRRHLGNIDQNLQPAYVESAFKRAELGIERKDVIGTEWHEHAEASTRPVSKALLRLSRLRRLHDEIVCAHGQDVYDHIEANLHWEVFIFLGKLEPVIYMLTKT